MWFLIDGIESKGKQVFMCDTDSVITDAKLNDYPDLMEEFMWDGCGDALGSLKNEADDHLKDCGWAKDDIKRLREEEGRMLHFDARKICQVGKIGEKWANGAKLLSP